MSELLSRTSFEASDGDMSARNVSYLADIARYYGRLACLENIQSKTRRRTLDLLEEGHIPPPTDSEIEQFRLITGKT